MTLVNLRECQEPMLHVFFAIFIQFEFNKMCAYPRLTSNVC